MEISSGKGYEKIPLLTSANLRGDYQFASGFNESICGRLRVSVPSALCVTILGSLLVEFSRNYPDITIDLDAGSWTPGVGGVDFDIAIRMERQPDSNLITRAITSSKVLLCASPAYLAKHGIPRHPSELQQHDGLLCSLDGPVSKWEFCVDGQLKEFPIRERLKSECRSHLVEAACANLGLLMAPSFMVAGEIAMNRLHVILRDFTPRPATISVIYPESRKQLQKVRALIDFLGQRLADYRPWDLAIDDEPFH